MKAITVTSSLFLLLAISYSSYGQNKPKPVAGTSAKTTISPPPSSGSPTPPPKKHIGPPPVGPSIHPGDNSDRARAQRDAREMQRTREIQRAQAAQKAQGH